MSMKTFLSTRVSNFAIKIFSLMHIKWSFPENC